MRYFLGADLGGTKTHMLITDETGQVLGFGEGGPANHQTVGYEGMLESMHMALGQALTSARIPRTDVSGAGFGIAGYDWPSELPNMLAAVARLELNSPLAVVNDAIPGLVAGSQEGWGVNIVSGTGCNCRGWDRAHQREGRVTGYGTSMDEAAGSSELVYRAMQLVSHAWSRRGPETALCNLFINYCGAKNLEDLIEGYTEGYYSIGAEAAPLIFQVALAGDPTAIGLISWAGDELGELANCVIRQLQFEELEFDVVLSGSMFEGGSLLIDPLRKKILALAPRARLVRLRTPPVVGALIIGMEQGHQPVSPAIRSKLAETIQTAKNAGFRAEG